MSSGVRRKRPSTRQTTARRHGHRHSKNQPRPKECRRPGGHCGEGDQACQQNAGRHDQCPRGLPPPEASVVAELDQPSNVAAGEGVGEDGEVDGKCHRVDQCSQNRIGDGISRGAPTVRRSPPPTGRRQALRPRRAGEARRSSPRPAGQVRRQRHGGRQPRRGGCRPGRVAHRGSGAVRERDGKWRRLAAHRLRGRRRAASCRGTSDGLDPGGPTG